MSEPDLLLLHDLLVVASQESSPLCTDAVIPTWRMQWDVDEDWWPDGTWMKVCVCGNGPLADSEESCGECDLRFTVARWAEAWTCAKCGARWPIAPGGWKQACPHNAPATAVGAIVELVEVAGPSHHASECGVGRWTVRLCGSDYDGWHTSVETVTPIDPVPHERPVTCRICCRTSLWTNGTHDEFWCQVCGHEQQPVDFPSSWVADQDVTRRLQAALM